MNQRIPFISIYLPIILIAFLFSTAHAEWWKSENVREKLSLTEDQVKEMDRVFAGYQKSRVDRRAEMQKIQLDLDALLSQEKLDEKKVEQRANDFSQARQEMLKEMMAMKLAVRKVLSAEQVKRILASQPDTFSISNSWGSKRNRMKRAYKRGKVKVREGGEQ